MEREVGIVKSDFDVDGSSSSPESTRPTSETVVDKALVVEEELKEETPYELRAEQESMGDDDDFVFPKVHPKCDICGRGHLSIVCAYLTEIPPGGELLNHDDYLIVCHCGQAIVNDCCSGGNCAPCRGRRVIKKSLLAW